jgi:hypothetical protein
VTAADPNAVKPPKQAKQPGKTTLPCRVYEEPPFPMTRSVTRRLALGLVAGAALFASAASAQDFPNRIIKMVVPYPAGGPTDVIARIVAEEMGRSLGQNDLPFHSIQ